jgi:hypothetical protein
VVKEKMRCYVSDVFEGRHGFSPLGEVICCHNNVLVSISRWRVSSHEVNAPFTKWVGRDDWV